jgi:CheY-like chemotaxis protein
MNPISVLHVDDNSTFLRIAARLLQEQSDVVVVGTAGGGQEVLAQGQGLQPDIVLGDLACPA